MYIHGVIFTCVFLFVDTDTSTVRPAHTLIRVLFVHKHSIVADHYYKYAHLLLHCVFHFSDSLRINVNVAGDVASSM